jgi:hypothetical protein
MAAEKPENNQPERNDSAASDNPDESDALKRAIMKLREQGLLTHIPEELLSEEEKKAETKSTPEKTIASRPIAEKQEPSSAAKLQPEPASDDITISSPSSDESPIIASSDKDDSARIRAATEQQAAERTEWSSVLSGWDSMPAKEEKADELDNELLIDAKMKTQESSQIRTIDPDDEKAITLTRKEIKPPSEDALTSSRDETPWTLQQFFDGEIDLDKELSKRFPTIPPMTTIKFRTLGSRSGRKVATLSTQDGNASLIIDADVDTKVVQMSFSYGSMLTLRFSLNSLNDSDRSRWLELMRREQGGLAFLWGPSRWNEDYLICIARKYSTNIYAFSPRNFESAIRMTASVTTELLNWLEEVWTTVPEPEDDDDSPLLTW